MTDADNTIEAAERDFEPLDFQGRQPDWSRFPKDCVAAHKAAWVICQKTKSQLMKMATELGDEACAALADNLMETIALYRADLEVLDSALDRFMTAAAASIVRDNKTARH